MRTLVGIVVLAFTLQACDRSTQQRNFTPVRDVIQRLVLEQQAGLPPKTPGPYLSVKLLSSGAVNTLTVLDTDGPVVTWKSNSGAQIITRNGVLIATRGYGADLMSAAVPEVAMLVKSQTGYQRSYHLLDGNDTPVRQYYNCAAERLDGSATTVSGASYHVVETCDGEAGRIRNEYWISRAMTVLRSRQFVSVRSGYFEITAMQK